MPNEIDELRAELAKNKRMLAAFQTQGTTIKVSAKGGVSIYGLGRYPTTLYRSQMIKLLDMADTIRAFMVEHEAELPLKGK
jgi:hypothetical protein